MGWRRGGGGGCWEHNTLYPASCYVKWDKLQRLWHLILKRNIQTRKKEVAIISDVKNMFGYFAMRNVILYIVFCLMAS